MKLEHIGGWLFADGMLQKGYLAVSGDEVVETCLGSPPEGSERALILPAFVNAHVHSGDAVAYPAPSGSVEELVAPPDGFKHRVLRSKTDAEKLEGMRRALQTMALTGTCLSGDFREEGVGGVRALRRAAEGLPLSLKIFGRPSCGRPSSGEIHELVRECDGIGMSALSDWPYELLSQLSAEARRAGKMFAMHASEARREDMEKILELAPDFVVHMCSATEDDIAAAVQQDVAIVVCPRSNAFFGLSPGIPRLLKAGATVALGTDNCMLSVPDMIEELKAAYRAAAAEGGTDPGMLVSLATTNARKVLNAKAKITTEITPMSDLVAVRVRGEDPLLWLVTEASSEDIVAIARGGVLRRTGAWTR